MTDKHTTSLPYSDTNMVWDESQQKYYLTITALSNNGIDIDEELDANGAVHAEKIKNRLIRYTTTMVYNYIHEHAVNNRLQDVIIASVPSARNIIYNALLSQAEYLMLQGDLSRSIDHRDLSIDFGAKKALEETMPEIGRSILYCGG